MMLRYALCGGALLLAAKAWHDISCMCQYALRMRMYTQFVRECHVLASAVADRHGSPCLPRVSQGP